MARSAASGTSETSERSVAAADAPVWAAHFEHALGTSAKDLARVALMQMYADADRRHVTSKAVSMPGRHRAGGWQSLLRNWR